MVLFVAGYIFGQIDFSWGCPKMEVGSKKGNTRKNFPKKEKCPDSEKNTTLKNRKFFSGQNNLKRILVFFNLTDFSFRSLKLKKMSIFNFD
jgi:hypothetical protein